MIKEPLGKTVKFLKTEIKRFLDFHLDEYQLGNGQFTIILDVCKNRGISQDVLSKNIGVDKTTIAKSVKKLVENGYITKEEDEKDRRSKKIYPTKKAEDILPKLKNLDTLEKEIFSQGITQDEMEIFLKVSGRIKSNIKYYLEDGGDSNWKK
ncbi:MarR family winged helix-turn-helix transcriptional regulator [Ilyobacter sp.]|uniref:MarR family winged helix-turn-helix transcriptional regulator n=1 Tax=Ilyobacter sp. TaxID=3100343 RepID=UPI0035641037